MPNPIGGPVQTVIVVTGRAIRGGPVLPVYAYNAATIGKLGVEGGPSMPVKVVSAAELESGVYFLEGDTLPIPVILDSSGQVEGGPAIPIYLVGGSL
jgi:hypothetical protein